MLNGIVLLLLSAAVTLGMFFVGLRAQFLLWGRAEGEEREDGVSRSHLLWFGGTTLVCGLTARLATKVAGSGTTIELSVGFLLLALLWLNASVIARLCLEGMGRLRAVFAVAGALLGSAFVLSEESWVLALPCFFPVTMRTPWMGRRTGSGTRTVLFLASTAVIAAASNLAPSVPDLPPSVSVYLRLGAAISVSFALAMLFRLPFMLLKRLFDLLKLRTRLVVSYILVAGTPVILAVAFVVILAILAMGGFRVGLVTRLLEPGAELRRSAASTADDPETRRALSMSPADRMTRFDAVARRYLGDDEESFLLAGRWSSGDAAGLSVAAGPLGTAPAEFSSLTRLSPPFPYRGFMLVESDVYSTVGEVRADRGDTLLVQVFRYLTDQVTVAASDIAETEVECYISDSIFVNVHPQGTEIDWGGDPRRVQFVSHEDADTGERGLYFGAKAVPAWRLSARETLTPAGGVILIRTPWRGLLASITDTVSNPFNRVLWVILAVIGVLFGLVEMGAVIIGGAIARNINRAIVQLARGTRELAAENFEHRVEVSRGDELGELAQAFNRMAADLKEGRRLAIEQERLRSELRVAHEIQQRLMPTSIPQVPGLDIAGISIPSREVGGDTYDVQPWGSGLVAVSIADVSGKGIPAALLMSNYQAAVRSQAKRGGNLPEVMGELNELVLGVTDTGRFITSFLGTIDPRTGIVRFTNAGHNPPILRSAGGRAETLLEGGLLLGALPGAVYEGGERQLAPGDSLILYTDGVVEACREDGEFFEDERLLDLLAGDMENETAAVTCERITSAVEDFLAGAELSDDLTVVIVRRIASGE